MSAEGATLPNRFDAMFATDDDPWGVRSRWYESRKRDITLASLPHPGYRRGYEPGCANGELTRALASRCDTLLASDGSANAIAHAQGRLGHLTNVSWARRCTPDDWPCGEFDLIVLSELGYYLDDDALSSFVERSAGSLTKDGILLACHWRHPAGDFHRSGDAVHEVIDGECGMTRIARHLEKDFVLDVWSRDGVSVAQRERLA